MNDLRERLAALAGQAANYADAGAVLHRLAARRRRRAAVAATLLAVLVLSAAAFWAVHRARVPRDTPAVPVPGAPAVRYPVRVDPPARPAPVLPTDRGVGVASFIYLPCGGCSPNLVLPDGRQYRLGNTANDPGQIDYLALSPDGRWLRRVEGYQQVVLRDLTGTTVYHLPASNGLAGLNGWSPDGRWMLATQRGQGRTDDRTVTDLRTGNTHTVAQNTVAVYANGDLLVVTKLAYRRLDLRVEHQDGGVVRQFTVDAGRALRGSEDILGYTENGPALPRGIPLSADGLLLLPVSGNSGTALVMSTKDGSLVRRVQLPQPSAPYQDWAVVGFDGSGLLVRHQAMGAQPSLGPSAGQRQELSLLDPRHQTSQALCSLPANFGSALLLRGALYAI